MRRATAKQRAIVYESRTNGDTNHKAAGRAAHDNALRRGGLEAAERSRDKALQERDKNRAQATDAEVKSRDAAATTSEMKASVSPEKGLRLAAEAVNMKAEEDIMQVESWQCGQGGSVGLS